MQQPPTEQAPTTEPPAMATSAGFLESRFGLFIHLGPSSVAARHDWVQSTERLTIKAYRRYVDHFDPDLYDPRAWTRMARAAGTKYVVVTTKHHDGFCLWDSAVTDYKATRTPCGRDLIAPLVEAYERKGCALASTTPSSSGTIRTSPSTASTRSATTRASAPPGAATSGDTPTTCTPRCSNC